MKKTSSLKIWIAASALAAVVLVLGALSYRDALVLTDKLVVLQAKTVIEFIPTWAQRSEAHARRDVFSSGVVALFALLAGAFLSRQQKRAQLAESKAKAAEHLAHLGEMSAVLAHEIKNPLASLKGHAQLLEEKLEGKPKDKAGLVISEAKRLQTLIGDLLDFARTKDIERREVAVKTLVERTLRDFGELEFNVDLSKAPDFFALEQGSFERVLSNLIDNARTWGENQSIDVALVKEKDELVLSVRDRGPGVSDDIKDKIFAPFFTQKTRDSNMAKILVTDDEPGVRSFIAECLEAHEVSTAEDGEQALRLLRQEAFHLLISDVKMPKVDGLELLQTIKSEQPELEVLMLSAHGTVSNAVEAMRLGAFDFVQKPVESPKAIRVMVSGTGKEVSAKAIHELSEREGAFVAVNCAVLSETLLESELFGHEKGAFTGAEKRRRGKLELADGGTFFLDEVGELKPVLQAKLLRALQERTFERVGGNQTIATDARFVAATNRDLEAMVQEGTFREDLFHRLSVFPIWLPPLSDRREDIPKLCEVLLHSLQLGRQLSLSKDALEYVCTASWKGNIRALRNALERAAILTDGVLIERDAFMMAQKKSSAQVSATDAPTMAEAEKRAIVAALKKHEGNRKKAAAHLEIGERTLYDKIKKYEIAL